MRESLKRFELKINKKTIQQNGFLLHANLFINKKSLWINKQKNI